jgi:N-acetylgalactosamine kinase
MAHQQVINSVLKRYEELTHEVARKVCVAPGRVNLIGEHIDYNGFGVLPCAIDRVTVVAIGVSQSHETKEFCVSQVSSVGPEFDVSFDTVPEVNKECHHWSNYVQGAYLSLRESGVQLPRGMVLVIGGDLPQACGLSSSSSLVVACVMAMSSLASCESELLPREKLAEISTKAEWLVGTAGGGMDQAAILLSEKGFASHIEFNPVRITEKVKLPKGVSFVVANSQVRSAKAETVNQNFNKRVFECKLGQILLRSGLSLEDRDIVEDNFSRIHSDKYKAGAGFGDILNDCESLLPEEPVSREKVVELIGQETLDRLLKGLPWARGVWEANEFFSIYRRALHVYKEAERVETFISACAQGNIHGMIDCINSSGDSLDINYECSVPELRELVHVMRESGCVAARLVGAGFGGCALGMIMPEDDVEDVMGKIRRKFFFEQNRQNCFSFEPAAGCAIYDP